MSVESIEYNGMRYAMVIWADTQTDRTVFFSPPESSFQFGLLAHANGFVEAPHFHKSVKRIISDQQQMFVVQKGAVAVKLYTRKGEFLREMILRVGDAILLIEGAHSICALEDMQCISVKQGPYFNIENDKIFLKDTP